MTCGVSTPKSLITRQKNNYCNNLKFSYNFVCTKKEHRMENKYLKLHSLLRMFGALLAIVVFISMFTMRFLESPDLPNSVFFDFNNGFFFNDSSAHTNGNWITFIGFFFILIGGLAGLAFVFIDELIGKDLTKTLSFVAGGLALLGGLTILLSWPLFMMFNSDFALELNICAGPIVFGILALLAGAAGVSAPILESKGL